MRDKKESAIESRDFEQDDPEDAAMPSKQQGTGQQGTGQHETPADPPPEGKVIVGDFKRRERLYQQTVESVGAEFAGISEELTAIQNRQIRLKRERVHLINRLGELIDPETGRPLTGQQIGEILGVSRQRVHQLRTEGRSPRPRSR